LKDGDSVAVQKISKAGHHLKDSGVLLFQCFFEIRGCFVFIANQPRFIEGIPKQGFMQKGFGGYASPVEACPP
jgi:hypothetical protein